MSSVEDLRARLTAAAKRLSVREIAGRADVSHQTVYDLIAGDRAVGVQRGTQRKLERFLSELDAEQSGGTPVGMPVGTSTGTPAGLHAPSYWEGRLDSTAATLDAMATLLAKSSAELRQLVASGVLHGATPAGDGWISLRPATDAEIDAVEASDRAAARSEAREQAANATPAARQKRRAAGGRG